MEVEPLVPQQPLVHAGVLWVDRLSSTTWTSRPAEASGQHRPDAQSQGLAVALLGLVVLVLLVIVRTARRRRAAAAEAPPRLPGAVI